MKRVIVIGCPGSGKSTLSRELSKRTGIPLYHLDMMYWNSDRTVVKKDIFLFRLREALKGEEWIIDGNYSSTMQERMEACDTVIFLDYPTNVCLEGIRARIGKKRSDLPWIEVGEDKEFTEYVKSFEQTQRPMILGLLDRFCDKETIILKSREEADGFLSGLLTAESSHKKNC